MRAGRFGHDDGVIRLAHTGELDAVALTTIRKLLDGAYPHGFSDTDWANALGGVHALAFDGDVLVGHAALVLRRLLLDGRVLRTGYIEAMGVREDQSRRGIAGTLMAPLEALLRGYELGALCAASAAVPLYTGRGWIAWEGPTYVLSPSGILRTADEDGGIYVFPGEVPLDLAAPLTCDWREGDVW